PSLAQTQAWIAERLPELSQGHIKITSGGIFGVINTTTASASLDSTCSLRIESETRGDIVGSQFSRARSVQRVRLREVDVNSIHPFSGSAMLESHGIMISVAGTRELILDSTFELPKMGKPSATGVE